MSGSPPSPAGPDAPDGPGDPDAPGDDTPARALEALVDRLLPGGVPSPEDPDGAPGGLEAGAADYVLGVLEGPRGAAWAPHVLRFLGGLDARAREETDRPFAALSAARRDALIEAWITPRSPPTPASGAQDQHRGRVFAQLVRFSLEGLLGHPRHGGNRDGLGWARIGWQRSASTAPSQDPCAEPVLERDMGKGRGRDRERDRGRDIGKDSGKDFGRDTAETEP